MYFESWMAMRADDPELETTEEDLGFKLYAPLPVRTVVNPESFVSLCLPEWRRGNTFTREQLIAAENRTYWVG